MPTEHADGACRWPCGGLSGAWPHVLTGDLYPLGPHRCLPTRSDLTDAYLPARTSPMPTYPLGPRRCPPTCSDLADARSYCAKPVGRSPSPMAPNPSSGKNDSHSAAAAWAPSSDLRIYSDGLYSDGLYSDGLYSDGLGLGAFFGPADI